MLWWLKKALLKRKDAIDYNFFAKRVDMLDLAGRELNALGEKNGRDALTDIYNYANEEDTYLLWREYGDYITGPKLITEETKKTMKKILTDIQDGTFAKEFLLDMSPAGRQVHFKAMRKLASEHPSEKVGAEIRKLYSWNNESDKLINN